MQYNTGSIFSWEPALELANSQERVRRRLLLSKKISNVI